MKAFYLSGSYLVLELANGCNLRCQHCAQSDTEHPHYKLTGYFPRAGVRALLRDLAESGAYFDALILFWLGEPLLHPEFAEIYEEVLEYCGPRVSGSATSEPVSEGGVRPVFGQIELHTNATMLSRKMAAKLLNRHPAPQRWHLTIDAADAGTYRAIKGLDLLDRVEENVARIIAYKGRGGFTRPQLVLQYIVSDRNEGEVEPFIARWTPVFEAARLSLRRTAFHVPHDFEHNYLFFKSLDCPTAEEQAHQNGVYQRVVRRLGLIPPFESAAVEHIQAPQQAFEQALDTPCSGFWKSPVIGFDGMLTTCTRDSLGDNSLGNVLQTPFTQLWFGEGRIQAWRREVGKGDYHSLSLCQSCFIPKSVNYSGITAQEIESVSVEVG